MRRLRKLIGDTRGASAVELAIWAAVLVAPVFAAANIGFYTYRRMQLFASAQAAVSAAWRLCDTTAELPAVQNCTNLLSTMTTAAQGTSLGAAVTLASASVTEGYYCPNGSNTLVLVSGTTTRTIGQTLSKPSPFTCQSTTGDPQAPGDYLKITVAYTNTNVFGNLWINNLLPSAMTKDAWMRLD